MKKFTLFLERNLGCVLFKILSIQIQSIYKQGVFKNGRKDAAKLFEKQNSSEADELANFDINCVTTSLHLHYSQIATQTAIIKSFLRRFLGSRF